MLTVYNVNESRWNTTKAARATDNLRSGFPNASDQNSCYMSFHIRQTFIVKVH